MTNADRFRELIRRGFIEGDLSVCDEIGADNYIENQYLVPKGLTGSETLKQDITEVRKQFPDFDYQLEDIVEVGDKVWSRLELRGVDPATGKTISMSVMDICRFEDGKIVEHWGIPDRFAYLHQLGLIPEA